MRSRLFLSLVGAVALLAASAAQAGTLTSATWTQTSQGFPMTIVVPSAPGALGIVGTSTATSIGVFLSYPLTTTQFFVPKTVNGLLDLAISITQGGPQNLVANAVAATATQGVNGLVLVMTAGHLTAGANQSNFFVGAATLVGVPVNVGVSGLFTGMLFPLGVPHNIWVVFYAWTPGTLTFGGLTNKGVATPDVVAMGSFNLTAGGGGTVTLVSPTLVNIDCGLAQRRNASFTALRMVFVPEPGTLLLLGAGALGLVLVGSRKR